MATRDQIVQLGNAVPAFVAALAPVAVANPAVAAAFERATAALRTTVDPVEQAALLVEMIRALGVAGADEAQAWIIAADKAALIPATTISPGINRQQGLARCASALIEGACWQEAAVAIISRPPQARADASFLRSRIAAGVEPVLDRVADLCGAPAYDAIRATVDTAIKGLDRLILELAPLAQISFERRVPSTVAAWLLYGDPDRAEGLVARAQTLTPFLMPRTFLAQAPSTI